MQITRYECDFNPNLRGHEANYRVSFHDNNNGDRAGTFDACYKHVGQMITGKLDSGMTDIKLVTVVVPSEKVASPEGDTCEVCGKEGLKHLRLHQRKEHQMYVRAH